jgi:hypothetical protein
MENCFTQLIYAQCCSFILPASTYEIALAGGNYPTYRLFNTNGELDIENAAYPRELTKIDFTLFAATQKITINDAKKCLQKVDRNY